MEVGEVNTGELNGLDVSETSAGRRPSITQLQDVLRRVSLSPFHGKHKTPVSPTPDAAAGPQLEQKSEFLFDLSGGTEASANQPTQNSSTGGNGVLPNVKDLISSSRQRNGWSWPSTSSTETPEPSAGALHRNDWAVFPPPEIGRETEDTQATPTDHTSDLFQATPNNHTSDVFWATFTNHTFDLFQATSKNHTPDLFPVTPTNHTPDLFPATPTNHTSDLFQATPTNHTSDLFQAPPTNHTSDLFQATSTNHISNLLQATPTNHTSDFFPATPTYHTSDLFQAPPTNHTSDLFQATPTNHTSDFFPATPTNHTSDIFQATPPSWLSEVPQTKLSNQKADIFQPFRTKEENPWSTMTTENKGSAESSSERDFLLEYILANQKNDDGHPAPSPTVAADAFLDTPRFFPPPVINEDLFPDVFSASKESFQTPPSTLESRVLHSTPPSQTPVSSTPAARAFDPLSDEYVASEGPFKPQGGQLDKLFSSPGAEHTSPDTPPVNGLMFRRRPPKPAPRRNPKNWDQAVDHHSLSKPAPTSAHSGAPQSLLLPVQAAPTAVSQWNAKTSIQVRAPPEEVNSKVYEDVLLIGQERCVEDWPEDSPQLSPDWKPAGKLRLRRDSLRVSAEPEGALTPESFGKKHGKLKAFLSRRGSKDKSGDDLKGAQTATLGREPTERSSDGVSGGYGGTLPWGTKFHDAVSDDVLSSEQDELGGAAVAGKPVKQKKRTKLIVPQLRYRTSTKTSTGDVSEDGFHSTGLPASKGVFEDDLKRKKTDLQFVEELKDLFRTLEQEGATGYTPSHESQVGYLDEPFSPSGPHQSAFSDHSGKQLEMQDCRPKKPVKLKVPRSSRRDSKAAAEEASQKGADLFKASDVQGSELNGHEDYSELKKPPILRVPPLSRRDSQGLQDPVSSDKGADLFKAGDCEDAENWKEEYSPDSKPPKVNKSPTPGRESQAKDDIFFPEDFDPPGATSGDFYLSEAAKAEWMSSQMDVRRTRGPDEEERLEGVEEEEEGDTDSLMEWWNTVELWDELPSDEEITLKEDETVSFTEIAGKVHRGLRVFYKVFTEQAEVLYQHVLFLYAIADDLSNFHRRAKIANITGGTTTAVGGVAAIAGLALSSVTFGTSLIVSAVGLGVAMAGGIISDNIHDMNDHKKIEVIMQDYETRLTEMQRCLRFVAEGIWRLRSHRLLRRNNYYTGDWEVRRALQTISLVTEPVERAEEIVDAAMVALTSVCQGMDMYFTKDSRELKKGCKKEVTMRVRMLAKQLQDGLVQLSSIREQLLDATGHV